MVSFAIGASLNQGNSENGTKSSSVPSKSQKPWFETFVTSASKVFTPARIAHHARTSPLHPRNERVHGAEIPRARRKRTGIHLRGRSSRSKLILERVTWSPPACAGFVASGWAAWLCPKPPCVPHGLVGSALADVEQTRQAAGASANRRALAASRTAIAASLETEGKSSRKSSSDELPSR